MCAFIEGILFSKEFWAAIIGGIFTLFGGVYVFKKQVSIANEEYNRKKIRVRNAIYAEMEELLAIYKKQIKEPFQNRIPYCYKNLNPMPITTTVYDENASFIAEIDSSDVAKKVIRFYILLKSINEMATFISKDYQLGLTDGRKPDVDSRLSQAATKIRGLKNDFESLAKELLPNINI